MIKIIRTFSNTIRTTVAAYKLERADILLSNDDIIAAEQIYDKWIKKFDNLYYEYQITLGYIKYKLDKDLECINLFKEAWDKIESDPKVYEQDAMYLKSFIWGIISLYKQFLEFDEGNIEAIEVGDIDLSKVTPRLQRDFPQRDHPDWYKYNKE